MDYLRAAAIGIVCLVSLGAAPSLDAQTSATIQVSARVVEECTVSVGSKRELVKLARKLGDPSIVRRCSKGVLSRVDRRAVTRASLLPAVAVTPGVSSRRVAKVTTAGKADVLLVTVSY